MTLRPFSLYPSVSTASPCRMWSVERVSTRDRPRETNSIVPPRPSNFIYRWLYEYTEFEYTVIELFQLSTILYDSILKHSQSNETNIARQDIQTNLYFHVVNWNFFE